MKDDERSLVDAVVSSINGGVFDHYLKAIVDASIARRRALSEYGDIPMQFRIALTPKPPVLDDDYEEDDDPVPAPPKPKIKAPRKPVATTFTAPSGTLISGGGGGGGTTISGSGAFTINSGHTTQHHRPDPDTPTFRGVIPPLSLAEQARMDEDQYVVLHNYAYAKREFYGKVVELSDIHGMSDQRVMVIGIGKKQLKVLYVNEPPQGTLRNENPHQKWRDVEEDYFDRSYVDPILGNPPAGRAHEYRTTTQ